MVKTYQNLELFGADLVQELSILESRKNNLANIEFSSRSKSRSTPKRMTSAVKLVQYQRGLRKSSSLTNGMSLPETKAGLESMAKKAEVSCLKSTATVNASILGTSADTHSIAMRRRH